MADTPKSPGRRLLRKSALQASPFGATIKSFHTSATTSKGASSSSTSPPRSQTQSEPQSQPQAQEHGLPNPFNDSPSSAGLQSTPVQPDSPLDHSPSSRKSARLSSLYRQNGTPGSGNSPTQRTPTRTRLMPPNTPKKTKIKTGVWGHIVGLKKQDESEYYRYPIDKSYCSFGRNDTNDIRVQIDAVSDLHCKLIRRDDGEVWLKDTSSDGTLLNDVLLHNTARIIFHYDVLTIAGRKFRFEVVAPSSTTVPNTPGKDIRAIQASVDKELFSLARTSSPKPESRILTTPRRNTARSAAELESSLGLFTPNRAAKLSSLLVSPKPVPLPAFLTQPLKSTTPQKSTTPRKTYVMVDEPSILNPSPESEQPLDRLSERGMTTPTRDKRKATEDMSPCAGRTPKKVSFGPALSPEVFDKSNPPSTPVKRGQQQDPDTPRRNGVSTPTLLSRLQSVGSVSKPILTPSRLRTGLTHNITKPKPLSLRALANMDDDYDPPQTEKAPEVLQPVEPPQALYDNEAASPREEMEDPFSDCNDVKSDNQEAGSSSPDDGRWKKLVAMQESFGDDADSRALDSLTAILSSDLGPDDTDESPPVTPTRPPREELSDHLRFTPIGQARGPSYQDTNDESVLNIQSTSTPFDDNNPFMEEEEDLLQDPEMLSPLSSSSASPPSSPSPSAMSTERHVHTPIRRSEGDINHQETIRTPGSASRLALLQLSAQKLQGLPDLLQVSSDVAPSAPANLSASGLADRDEWNTESGQLTSADREEEFMAQDEGVDGTNDEATTNDAAMDTREAEDSRDQLMRTPSPPNTRHLSIFSSTSMPNRRLSAPASAPMDRSQSPIFTGLRSVFRTPQKVVEFGFASFAGFRNYVRTPTKDITNSGLMESAPLEEKREDLVVNLEVQTLEKPSDPQQDTLVMQVEEAEIESELQVAEKTDDSVTTPRRQTTHQDALEILVGGREPSPKSKDFAFVRSQESMFQSTRTLEQIRARGRRSDIFPQRRTMVVRSQSHSDENRQIGSDMEKVSGGTNRRRTISLTEFKQVASKVLGFGGRQPSEMIAASDSSDKENEPLSNASAGQLPSVSKEDAEQAELLRLLGEGGSEDSMENEQSFEQMEMLDQEDANEDESGDRAIYGGADDAVFVDEAKLDLASTPSSRRSSGVGTPSKRRQSLKHRLGSSSPAFRRYEHPEDDDEYEEENEDDMVVMISPKRVRVQPAIL
ncbi:hypothetical protein EMPS_06072 [Entomortierella parvispora]|uniref:FHA domain-containing protein n=1 Tax=Entomortierella parvispora TaxID=205924 RepID=A0A9P3HBL7_9FUNG|nr:hypothetical protein EMPS_06072 [Entomortierella parvispora]